MGQVLLVRGARQLLTLRGSKAPRRGAAMSDLGVLENGAILVENGIVKEVGPARRVENLGAARRAETIDATGCVVTPGFIDSHTHLVCGPPRLAEYEMRLAGKSSQEIRRAGGGILSTVRAVRTWTTRRLTFEAKQVIDSMARCGTTTVEAKSGYGLNDSAEIKQLRIAQSLDGDPLTVINTCLAAHAVPPEFGSDAETYIRWCAEELIPEVARRRLARFADVRCEAGAFTPEQALVYLSAAKQHRLGIKLHAGRTPNDGAVEVGLRLGAHSMDHLEAVTPAEVEMIALSNTIATLLPASVLHAANGRYAPARALIDAGAAVALASNFNPGTSPVWNMQSVIALACSQMSMSPAEAITAATINGAHALGVAERYGSIEAGKAADLLLLQIGDYRELGYFFGDNQVKVTMKNGVVIHGKGYLDHEAKLDRMRPELLRGA